MMIYDSETLLFLDVNAAALHQYGYTREEILSMRLTDIRPAEEIPRVLEAVRKCQAELTFRGHWRHQRKNGEVFEECQFVQPGCRHRSNRDKPARSKARAQRVCR